MTDTSQKKPGFLRRAATRFFCVIGFMTVMSLSLSYCAISHPPKMPAKILLTYGFNADLAEKAGGPSLTQSLLRAPETVADVVRALDHAAGDPRVTGFAARIDDLALSTADIQEIRAAVFKLRAAGKFAYVYARSYGGMGGGMGEYYLASAFSQVWLQPIGMVAINGVAAEVPFFKGILDKIGVDPVFAHKGIYKSAPESLTENHMTPQNREMMTALIGDLSSQITADIAAARRIAPDTMAALVDHSPYMDKEAQRLKLVDNIGYEDEILEAAKAKTAGDDTDPVDLMDYADSVRPEKSFREVMDEFETKRGDKIEGKEQPHKGKRKIALITASGEIGGARNGVDPDDMADAFDEASADEGVAAIVFRIDSPGGSPEAAESIRRSLMLAQKDGKPVVVSMGGYAASGGYWIAAPADKIIAEPGTITGSIGVFGGKFVFEKLWQKLGINWDAVENGQNARMWSMNKNFSPAEFARFDQSLAVIYDAFLTRVAEGRKMQKAAVAKIAEGRVYTGRQAKAIGLVDDLGGLDLAIAAAKALGGVGSKENVPVVPFPPEKNMLEMIMDVMTNGVLTVPAVKMDAASFAKILPEVLRLQPVVIR